MTLTASHAHCHRCNATFRLPSRLSRSDLNALVVTHADGRRVEFIKRLREAANFSLADAKGLMLHVTHDATCHWCGEPIPVTAISECSCGSTNVDLTLIE